MSKILKNSEISHEIGKIIVILGPTSSGKSDVAIGLAKKYNGEVISADSRQVYRGMDIGSGKVPRDSDAIPKDGEFISEGIVHHLIDVADPNEDFNISHFKTLAEKAIEKIIKRGKIPIICGGTGFWIDAIVKNTSFPEVAPDEKLREELSKKSLEELFSELEKLDPERAKNIDAKNKVRLIRAIEICKTLGRVPKLHASLCHPELVSGSETDPGMPKQVRHDKNWEFIKIGIKIEKEELHRKIRKRLEERFDQGMIEEVEKLHKDKKASWERLENFGLEYRWIARYLQKKVSMEEMREKLYFDSIHYAKRQMTWFKKNKETVWLENQEEINTTVGKFLENE